MTEEWGSGGLRVFLGTPEPWYTEGPSPEAGCMRHQGRWIDPELRDVAEVQVLP